MCSSSFVHKDKNSCIWKVKTYTNKHFQNQIFYVPKFMANNICYLAMSIQPGIMEAKYRTFLFGIFPSCKKEEEQIMHLEGKIVPKYSLFTIKHFMVPNAWRMISVVWRCSFSLESWKRNQTYCFLFSRSWPKSGTQNTNYSLRAVPTWWRML